MKLKIANRDYPQEGLGLIFKVLFECSVCKKQVEPDELFIGQAYIYAWHCGIIHEIGSVARTGPGFPFITHPRHYEDLKQDREAE